MKRLPVKWRQDPIRGCTTLIWISTYNMVPHTPGWATYTSQQNKKIAPTKMVDARYHMDTKII